MLKETQNMIKKINHKNNKKKDRRKENEHMITGPSKYIGIDNVKIYGQLKQRKI